MCRWIIYKLKNKQTFDGFFFSLYIISPQPEYFRPSFVQNARVAQAAARFSKLLSRILLFYTPTWENGWPGDRYLVCHLPSASLPPVRWRGGNGSIKIYCKCCVSILYVSVRLSSFAALVIIWRAEIQLAISENTLTRKILRNDDGDDRKIRRS